MNRKIRLILLPLVTIAIGFIVFYTFLHWLLIIKMGLLDPKEELVELWLPMALPAIPVWIWMRPRLKLLALQRKGKDTAFGYHMVAVLAIAVPAIIAQAYIHSATGRLTALNTINEISGKAPTLYYTLNRHYIDKDNAGINYTFDVGGKYNQDLNLHIYIASPIYDIDMQPAKVDVKEDNAYADSATNSGKLLYLLDGIQIDSNRYVALPPADVATVSVLKGREARAVYGKAGANGVVLVTSKKTAEMKFAPPLAATTEAPKAWLCTQYGKRISNRLRNDEKEIKYHAFYEESLKKFDETNLEAFVYLEQPGNNEAHAGYKVAIAKSNLVVKNTGLIMLEPRHTPFAERNGSKLMWVFISLAAGVLLFFLLLINPGFKDVGVPASGAEKAKAAKSGEGLQWLIPRDVFFITPLIAYANVLIFLAMVSAGLGFMSFGAKDLIDWGANYKPLTENGQWWRLLSSMFLHGGFMHLLGNMYGLLFAGIFLEPVMGRKKYAWSYLATGIAASAVSLWWHGAMVSVGASGAIFGLYGIFVVLLLTKSLPALNMAFLVNVLVFVGYNLVLGMSGGIDNAAHLGGLLSGVIIGLIIYPGVKENQYELPVTGS